MTFFRSSFANFAQIYELDFTSHSNQTINSGNNTLDDGTTWATHNHSYASTFSIVNGTGLRIITGTNGDWYSSATGGPGLTCSITSELDTAGTWENDYRLYVFFDWIPVTTGYRNTVIGYRGVNGLGENDIHVGWETASGGQATNATLVRMTANNISNNRTWSDATIFGYRVLIMDVYGRHNFTAYAASTYSGGWPAMNTWVHLGSGQWTPTSNMLTQLGSALGDLEVLLALFDLDTATGSELLVKRVRLDKR